VLRGLHPALRALLRPACDALLIASCDALRGTRSVTRRVERCLRGALSTGSVVMFELASVISWILVTWVRAGGELALAISPHYSYTNIHAIRQ
jgi:hypothetical protein